MEEGAEPGEVWRGDWLEGRARKALGATDRALCDLAEKLTRKPANMREQDLADLREHGLDDVALHDAVQVIAYFNYINRIADALHVDLELDMDPYP